MKKYGAIMMDPPWPFRRYSQDIVAPARGEQPYKVMSLGDIAALPVPDLLAKNAVVFLWKADSLPDMPQILARVWHMKVATDPVFVWVKPSIGLGYWSRKRCENVALLTQGNPKRLSGGVDQVIIAPRREHSRKPDEIYARIEALVPGPYLEMFARQQWPGWDVWGDQTDKFAAGAGMLE